MASSDKIINSCTLPIITGVNKPNMSMFKKKIIPIKQEIIEEFENPDEFGVKLKKNIKLQNHQIEVIKWMKSREEINNFGIQGCLNCSEMGTGKTIEALELVMSEYTQEKTPEFPTLILCSVSGIFTWKNEIEKFFGKSCEYLVAKHDLLPKDEWNNLSVKTLQKYKIVITNYETIRSLTKKVDSCKSLFIYDCCNKIIGIKNAEKPYTEDEVTGPESILACPWNRIIYDESHIYNNPKSLLFYSLLSLYSKYKLALTGTPIRNYSSDLYAQFRMIGFNKITNPKNFTINVYKECNLSENVLYMTKQDAGIVLPPMNICKVVLNLSDKEKEFYDYLYSSIRKAHGRYLTSELSFANMLCLFTRLRQYCSAPYTILSDKIDIDDLEEYNTDKNTENNVTHFDIKTVDEGNQSITKILETTKGMIDWLKNIEGNSGKKFIKIIAALSLIKTKIPKDEKILVFSSFKRLINLFEETLKDHKDIKYQVIDGSVTGDDRNNVLQKFKTDKEQRVLFMTYKVGSESLNLTEANHIFLMEPVWCPAVIEQTKCRVHRIGQEKPVNIYQFSVNGTIEEKMLQLCEKKQELVKEFVENKKESLSLTSQVLESILK